MCQKGLLGLAGHANTQFRCVREAIVAQCIYWLLIIEKIVLHIKNILKALLKAIQRLHELCIMNPNLMFNISFIKKKKKNPSGNKSEWNVWKSEDFLIMHLKGLNLIYNWDYLKY